ncbi:Transposase, Mutator family [compost metagenome]
MARFNKEQVKAFVNENNLKTMEDVQSVFKELFAKTLQSMLEAELDTELGYVKHNVKSKTTRNSRNGKTKKTVTIEYGEMEIAVPRDRHGEFEPVIVKKHQSTVTDIEDQFIAMYAKGVSTSDIQDHLHHLYGME